MLKLPTGISLSAHHYLLGLKWRDQFYVYLVLPFGLKSAPYINSVADRVKWIAINNYGLSDLIHYLDDFITVGPHDSSCQQNLATALAVCKQLGLPLHPQKWEGPAWSLDILSTHLNSTDQMAQLPIEKLTALLPLLDQWSGRRTCNRNQLESLIVHLHDAAKVVWPGRAFIRHMINLSSCFRLRHHPILWIANFNWTLNGGRSFWTAGIELAFGCSLVWHLAQTLKCFLVH